MNAPSDVGAYDSFAYPGFAYPATHPARLQVIGRLFGLPAPPAAQARVLELGCGDGGNLMSLAAALPDATLLGIDASAGAIARGNELIADCGLANITLRALDLQALPEDLPTFDYILSHGVYSWIPPAVRSALLEAIRRLLASNGVAYVSYNAYPGSYLRDMARDILGYHVRDIVDPHERLAAAQSLMQTIVSIEEPSPYAQVLREHMGRMLRYSDALLFHDDLAEISTPFYFHEFAEHAASHNLEFLAEADLFESQMRDVPESAGQLMDELPDDVIVREQYLDFFKNRMFRQTLLCHRDAPINRQLDDTQIESCFISAQLVLDREGEPAGQEQLDLSNGQDGGELSSDTFVNPDGFTVTTSESLVRRAMQELGDSWPCQISFDQLLERSLPDGADPSLAAQRLRVVLLQAHLSRIVSLHGCAAPISGRVAERPLASRLVRAQARMGMRTVSSLLHGNVRVPEQAERQLLWLLDGSRDIEQLTQEVQLTEQRVHELLAHFASVGLLTDASGQSM